MKKILYLAFVVLTLTSCATSNRGGGLCQKVCRVLPFEVDTLYVVGGNVFGFRSSSPISLEPDLIIKEDKSSYVSRVFGERWSEPLTNQVIWRNLVFSKRHKRVLCIDRTGDEEVVNGYVYLMEYDQKHPLSDNCFHWDITDRRNTEPLGEILEDYKEQTWQRVFRKHAAVAAPKSQDNYWRLIFHADSIADIVEAKDYYDAAFTYDKYILPFHLSMAAERMYRLGDTEKGNIYLRHRIRMEDDFYDFVDSETSTEFVETFQSRQQKYAYNLPLKKELEAIFEKDQRYRMEWVQACRDNGSDSIRNAFLQDRAYDNDRQNLQRIKVLLADGHYPSKQEVGELASLAPWMVIQHADFDTQTEYCDLLEQAAGMGNVPKMYIAMLRDRIDVRSGKPQRYGTQTGLDGKLCPLLDATKVNEWREEMGLPKLKDLEK